MSRHSEVVVKCYVPKEGVVLHADLPQFLGGSMVGQFEADGRLVLLKFSGPDLDVEVVTFVADL